MKKLQFFETYLESNKIQNLQVIHTDKGNKDIQNFKYVFVYVFEYWHH